jgi:hypothetical protein
MYKYKEYQDFIEIIKVILPLYKNNPKEVYLKKILVVTIRMLEYISPITASKKAQIIADKQGLGPLSEYIWKDQKSKNGLNDPKRKIFHWEHYYPVEQLIRELIELKKLNDQSIYKVIRKAKIVWILKEENRKLDKNYKSIRPNPKKAYKEAGIKLL